jgi:hypothetical protein
MSEQETLDRWTLEPIVKAIDGQMSVAILSASREWRLHAALFALAERCHVRPQAVVLATDRSWLRSETTEWPAPASTHSGQLVCGQRELGRVASWVAAWARRGWTRRVLLLDFDWKSAPWPGAQVRALQDLMAPSPKAARRHTTVLLAPQSWARRAPALIPADLTIHQEPGSYVYTYRGRDGHSLPAAAAAPTTCGAVGGES